MSNLKAWIRYDSNGRMVPGTMILREKKPSGKFKEMVVPSVDECCSPTTTTTTTVAATTTTTTTAAPEYGIIGMAQYGSRTTSPSIPGNCTNICSIVEGPIINNLYSATPMGTQPTIGMQLFKNAGLTLQFPPVYDQTGWEGIIVSAPGSNFNGGGADYPLMAYKAKWGNKYFALYFAATSWIGPENLSPVTNYALVDFRECSGGTCI